MTAQSVVAHYLLSACLIVLSSHPPHILTQVTRHRKLNNGLGADVIFCFLTNPQLTTASVSPLATWKLAIYVIV